MLGDVIFLKVGRLLDVGGDNINCEFLIDWAEWQSGKYKEMMLTVVSGTTLALQLFTGFIK